MMPSHISSVEMHVGMTDMHILYPCPCPMLLHRYDVYVLLMSSYMSQICDYLDHQTFSFVNFYLDL